MITNDRIRSLIATDRDALTELLAIAYDAGSHATVAEFYSTDLDLRELIRAARRYAAQPSRTPNDITRWCALSTAEITP